MFTFWGNEKCHGFFFSFQWNSILGLTLGFVTCYLDMDLNLFEYNFTGLKEGHEDFLKINFMILQKNWIDLIQNSAFLYNFFFWFLWAISYNGL